NGQHDSEPVPEVAEAVFPVQLADGQSVAVPQNGAGHSAEGPGDEPEEPHPMRREIHHGKADQHQHRPERIDHEGGSSPLRFSEERSQIFEIVRQLFRRCHVLPPVVRVLWIVEYMPETVKNFLPLARRRAFSRFSLPGAEIFPLTSLSPGRIEMTANPAKGFRRAARVQRCREAPGEVSRERRVSREKRYEEARSDKDRGLVTRGLLPPDKRRRPATAAFFH